MAKIIAFECEKCGQLLKTAQGYERHIDHCNRVFDQPFIKNKIKLTKNERKTTDLQMGGGTKRIEAIH